MKLLYTSILTTLVALTPLQPVFADEACHFTRAFKIDLDQPHTNFDSMNQHTVAVLFELNALLFRRTKSGRPVSELVESTRFDETTGRWLLTLRDNCGWSDGAPITADEVAEGLRQTYRNGEDAYIPGRFLIENGKAVLNGELPLDALGIRALDGRTVEIMSLTSPELLEQILTRVNFSPYPLHLTEEAQKRWESNSIERIASGPYYVLDASNERIDFAPNPYFCRDFQPVIKNVSMIGVQNVSAQIGLFVAGKVNALEKFTKIDLDALKARRSEDTYKVLPMNEEIVSFVGIAAGSPIENNGTIKRAITLLIEKEVMSRLADFEDGSGSNVFGLTYPYKGFSKELSEDQKMSPDERLALAQRLMESEGYSEDNRLKLRLITYNNSGFSEQSYALRSLFSRGYIDAEVEIMDDREEWERRRKLGGASHDYQIQQLGSDFSDASDFLNSLPYIFSGLSQDERFLPRVEATYDILDNEKRLAALKEIELDMLNTYDVASLTLLRIPWILDKDLSLKDYFNLSAINVLNSNCDANT